MSKKLEFEVTLEQAEDSQACGFYFPFDTKEIFGTKARVPVRGTINGTEFRSSLAPMGGGCHIMPVNTKLRQSAGVKAGDIVKVVLERDDMLRTVETPTDLLKAMRAAKLEDVWEKLNYTHRKEYVQAVEEAKREETRTRRIEKTIEQLISKQK